MYKMNEEIICFYSNYSEQSKKFRQLISKYIPMIRYIPLDNKQIRNKLVSSKTFNIEKVPCILVLSNENINVYEGKDAFNWANNIISTMEQEYKHEQQEIQKKIDDEVKRQVKSKLNNIPSQTTNIPSQTTNIPSQTTNIPSQTTNIPSQTTNKSTHIHQQPLLQPTHISSIVDDSDVNIMENAEKMQKERENTTKISNL
jgi:hypothetical protein